MRNPASTQRVWSAGRMSNGLRSEGTVLWLHPVQVISFADECQNSNMRERYCREVPIDEDNTSRETAARRLPMNWVLTFEATKTRAIRVLKAIYLAALFTLAMGLFCGELPESLRLVDDTSNDYVADSSASAARENEATRKKESPRKEAVCEERIASRIWQAERYVLASASASVEPAPISGQELLPLLSIRRT